MANPAGPSTPDATPRRSFTAPIRVPKNTTSATEAAAKEGVEVLYTHPDVKIFKFQTASAGASPGRAQSSSPALPWATPAERTVAAGPLEIYHVRGFMTTLHSGSLIHPLLPRSQCWCVDGVSKFVIRASIDTYYRIELPGETEEDFEKVEELKGTLQKNIFYERTPCPFARTFTVDLPEEQSEPRKKRRRHTEGKAKKWKLNDAYGWRPEGWQPGMDEPEEAEDESGSAWASGSENESSSQEEIEQNTSETQPADVGPSMRARAMHALRSASMPQQVIPQRTMPTGPRPKVYAGRATEMQQDTAETEQDGDTPIMRTFQPMPTDMPPSPPDSSAGIDYSEAQAAAEGWVDVERVVEVPVVEEQQDKAENEETEKEIETPARNLQDEPDSCGCVEDPSVGVDALSEQLRQRIDLNVEEEEGSMHSSGAGHVEVNEEALDESIHSVIVNTPMVEPDTAIAKVVEADDEQLVPTSEEAQVSTAPVAAGDVAAERNESEIEQQACIPGEEEDRPVTPPRPRRTNSDDPYVAIQARILARRSLSGTTSFHPLHKSPPRGSSSSNSSAATIISNRASRAHRSRSQQEDLATALVKRVYSVFLGPPAHLVALMLKIAARFASGAFGVDGVFHVESPVGSLRRPPGSYQLQTDGEHVEAVEIDYNDSEDEAGWEDDEDDFGVKLNRSVSNLTATGLRERRAFEID